jgi:c-di-GMP-binding flagellar brake protein YcgR
MSTLTDDDLDQFTTTSPREVAFHLRTLIHDGERLSVFFREGEESFMTLLVDIDEDVGLLYFDLGGSETLNRQYLDSPHSTLVCSPHGIRHQFRIGKVWEVTVDKRRTFATHIPKSFVRLQRREYFRLVLPMAHRPPCSAQLPDGRTLKLPLVDLGIGGIGSEMLPVHLDLAGGTILSGGRIDLAGEGLIRASLDVRYIAHRQHGTKEVLRLGFRFVNLSSSDEVHLQRYLTHVQRELKAHS